MEPHIVLSVYLLGVLLCVMVGVVQAQRQGDGELIHGGLFGGLLWPVIAAVGIPALLIWCIAKAYNRAVGYEVKDL